MKVIDLLNKIANGEEVPITIKWGNTIYYLREDGDIDFYSAIDGYELMDCLSSSRDLREEVEIIEEEKKIPEKITINANGTIGFPNGEWTARNMDKAFAMKINSIIDYLKSKGE